MKPPVLLVLTRQLFARLSPVLAIEVALSFLPFWPVGVLPQDLATYLTTALQLGRTKLG